MFGGIGGVPRKGGKADEPKLGVIASPSQQQRPSSTVQTPQPQVVARVEPIIIGKGVSDAALLAANYSVEPTTTGFKEARILPTQRINASVPRRSVRDLVAGRTAIAIVGSFKKWHWGQHPDEAYMADALESIGVKVVRLEASSRPHPAPEAGWAVFTGQPESRGNMPKWEGTHATVLWTLDWLPYYKERKPVIDAARRATLFITSDQYDWRGVMGMPHQAYMAAACEGIETVLQPGPPWKRTCAFMGSIYSERRKKIAEIVRSLGGDVRGAPGAWVYGAELARYVQETKVIVGDNAWNDVPFYWSSRNYVVPGAGGFLLTPRVPGLETHFQDGVHVACYESLADLEGRLHKWIADDGRREEVRRVGFLHVREKHNWRVRAREFIEILENRMNEKESR